ncbi:MAG: hypothetical protein KC535_04125 [Nanoarchaeota archaeon]|nr:hypothetical protein [Nanoarchaeota archaeon]
MDENLKPSPLLSKKGRRITLGLVLLGLAYTHYFAFTEGEQKWKANYNQDLQRSYKKNELLQQKYDSLLNFSDTAKSLDTSVYQLKR